MTDRELHAKAEARIKARLRKWKVARRHIDKETWREMVREEMQNMEFENGVKL